VEAGRCWSHSASSVSAAGREEGEKEHAEDHDAKRGHVSIIKTRGNSVVERFDPRAVPVEGAAFGHASVSF
jgi:hypothetical protein